MAAYTASSCMASRLGVFIDAPCIHEARQDEGLAALAFEPAVGQVESQARPALCCFLTLASTSKTHLHTLSGPHERKSEAAAPPAKAFKGALWCSPRDFLGQL